MKPVILIFLSCFLLAGCATVPFESAPDADFRQVDPGLVVGEFEAAVGQDFECLESVVFSFFGKDLTGMGFVSVNAASGAYALSCMNPAGIKLFEFRGIGANVETLFLPPQLDGMEDRFAESVAQDIRRIYFGWKPVSDAVLKHKKDRLVYRGTTGDFRVEHIYAGTGRMLTQKQFSKGWKTHCTIRYFDYMEIDGKLYPHGIVLHNKKYHYRLVLRVKQIYPMKRDG